MLKLQDEPDRIRDFSLFIISFFAYLSFRYKPVTLAEIFFQLSLLSFTGSKSKTLKYPFEFFCFFFVNFRFLKEHSESRQLQINNSRPFQHKDLVYLAPSECSQDTRYKVPISSISVFCAGLNMDRPLHNMILLLQSRQIFRVTVTTGKLC